MHMHQMSFIYRAYSQILMQAMLDYFPQLLNTATTSPLAAAVAAFLSTSPSMKKLDSIRDAAFQEVLPGKARVPATILAEVRLTLWMSSPVILPSTACIRDFRMPVHIKSKHEGFRKPLISVFILERVECPLKSHFRCLL